MDNSHETQIPEFEEDQKKMIPLEKATSFIGWIKDKLELDYVAESVKHMPVYRGQVYWCNFGMGVGYEIQKRRPAVVIQCDLTNIRNGNTIVVPITHNTGKRLSLVAVGPYYAEDGTTVILDGQANATQITRISKARLCDYICDLTPEEMQLIEAAVAREIDLMHYYVDIKKKFIDKKEYADKVVLERNAAQDELKQIRYVLNVNDQIDLVSFIKTLKESIDKKEE